MSGTLLVASNNVYIKSSEGSPSSPSPSSHWTDRQLSVTRAQDYSQRLTSLPTVSNPRLIFDLQPSHRDWGVLYSLYVVLKLTGKYFILSPLLLKNVELFTQVCGYKQSLEFRAILIVSRKKKFPRNSVLL